MEFHASTISSGPGLGNDLTVDLSTEVVEGSVGCQESSSPSNVLEGHSGLFTQIPESVSGLEVEECEGSSIEGFTLDVDDDGGLVLGSLESQSIGAVDGRSFDFEDFEVEGSFSFEDESAKVVGDSSSGGKSEEVGTAISELGELGIEVNHVGLLLDGTAVSVGGDTRDGSAVDNVTSIDSRRSSSVDASSCDEGVAVVVVELSAALVVDTVVVRRVVQQYAASESHALEGEVTSCSQSTFHIREDALESFLDESVVVGGSEEFVDTVFNAERWWGWGDVSSVITWDATYERYVVLLHASASGRSLP